MAPYSKTNKEDFIDLGNQMRRSNNLELNIPNTSWRVSVIDLGYNSLKMVSYEVRPDASFRAYNQRGELTKLGEGLDKSGMLSRWAIQRTMKVLTLLNEINRMEKVDRVLAVATSAVREASNGLKFVKKVESTTSIRFRILSKEEEALYSYIGGAMASNFNTALFFDLGGGSLELTYAKDRRIERFLSIPLGALRLTESYGVEDGGYSKRDYNRLRKRIFRLLPTREELDLDDNTVLIGVGGTVRAIARYDQRGIGYRLNKVHNYVLKRRSVNETHKVLKGMTVSEISRLEPFGKDRAESVTTGSLIISMLMERLDFRELIVSTHGLRDGILTEYLRDPVSYTSEKFSIEKANNLLKDLTIKDQSFYVVNSLFLLGYLSRREESMLVEAVGSFMDLYLTTRPETLFYSVIGLDSVLGHSEQVAVAIALVRAKSAKMARWYFEYYSPVLQGIKRDSIYKMSAVIGLEEILHRTGSRVSISSRKGLLTVEIDSMMGSVFPKHLLNEAIEELESAIKMRIKVILGKSERGRHKR